MDNPVRSSPQQTVAPTMMSTRGTVFPVCGNEACAGGDRGTRRNSPKSCLGIKYLSGKSARAPSNTCLPGKEVTCSKTIPTGRTKAWEGMGGRGRVLPARAILRAFPFVGGGWEWGMLGRGGG